MRPDLENLIPKDKALVRLFDRWTPKQEAEVIPLADAAALTADAVYASTLGEKAHAAGETIEVEFLR